MHVSMLLVCKLLRDLPVALTTHVRLTESPTVRNVGRGEMVTWGGTVCVCVCVRERRWGLVCEGREKASTSLFCLHMCKDVGGCVDTC